MITAEEFFRDKIKELHPHMENITLWKISITAEQGMRWGYEYSILKAKFHVEIALKEASKSISTTDDNKYIIESYPLENIK